MKNLFLLIFEELFPFIFFVKNKRRKINQIQTKNAPAQVIKEYSILSLEKLNQRLAEEHDRATKIDNKTVKFTLGLSVSLTILSTVSGTLVKLLPGNNINYTIIFLCGMSSVFMLIAGIISLGALKTLPKYGYGTRHEISAERKEKSHFAKVLFLQEEINIVRHLRNESAYQCLRNGFLLLLMALIISMFFIHIPVETNHTSYPSNCTVVIDKNAATKEPIAPNSNKKKKAITNQLT